MLRGRTNIALGLALGACACGGCSVAPRAASHASQTPTDAGTAQAVFTTPAVHAALAHVDPAALPEYSRRDADLAAVWPRLATAADAWPQPARDSLTRQRFYHLNTRTESHTFFVPERTLRRP